MPVAGQVSASDDIMGSISGFPKDRELAATVLEPPVSLHGKILCEGTDLEPTTEAGTVVKVNLEHGKWRFFNFNDTFSLTNAHGEPLAGGYYVKEVQNILGRSRLVLYNKDDHAITIAIQDAASMRKKYTIYGMKPLGDGSDDSIDYPKQQEQGVDFYPWFRVRDIDDNHLDHRSLQVWNGNNFMPMMKIKAAKRFADIEGLSDMVPPKKTDNLVVDKDDEDKVYALISKKSDMRIAGWNITVAPGVDPAMMIMLAAIMDDMIGWFA